MLSVSVKRYWMSNSRRCTRQGCCLRNPGLHLMCLPGQPGNHNHVPFISHSIPLSSHPTTNPPDCRDRSTSHPGLTATGFFAPLHPVTKTTKTIQVNHCYQKSVKLFAADRVFYVEYPETRAKSKPCRQIRVLSRNHQQIVQQETSMNKRLETTSN